MNSTKRNVLITDLTAASVCLALCMLLPLLTGQNRQIGSALSLMHIPVLLCGFICSRPYYAAAVGATAPLLRFLIFGMPPLMPIGLAMCFELAVYGIIAWIMYKMLPKKPLYIYVSLITSMLAGRAVWGIAMWLLAWLLSDVNFSWEIFMADAFIKAVPGIILHIVVIPVLVMALKKARFMQNP